MRDRNEAGDAATAQDQPALSLADKAYAILEERIVRRDLPPGAMISENQLSEELGMGRTPIREALQRLKHIGFVEIHPRQGALVSGVDVERQLDLLEVRWPLEELVVRCAAERATAAERAELDGLARDMDAAARTADSVRYFRANKLIHEATVRAAHNQVLTTTMHGIHAQSRRFWYAYVERSNGFAEGARLHGATIAAITRRDADGATQGAKDLIGFLERLTRNVLVRRVTG